jgi:DNA repair protein RadC
MAPVLEMLPITAIGSRNSQATLHVCDFLSRNSIHYVYVDLSDLSATNLLKKLRLTAEDAPIVIVGNEVCSKPTNERIAKMIHTEGGVMPEVRDCIGIHTHTDVSKQMQARDYVAVDSRGHRVWGPGKDYSEAKRQADKTGGVVQWIPEARAAEDIFSRSIRWTFDGHVYQGTGRKGDYLIVAAGRAETPEFVVYKIQVDSYGGINKEAIGKWSSHVDAMEFADKYDLDELEPVPSTRPEGITPPVAAEASESVPVIYEAGVREAIAPMQGECLPWVRVTRDPERYEACLANARKIGPIENSRKVYDLLSPALAKEDQEVLCVVLLDVRRQLRGVSEVHRGQRSRVSVGVTDIMRIVIASGAEAFVICHNHPSLRSTVSDADIQLTKSIEQACKPFGKDLTFLGHVVLGGMQEFSEIAPDGKVSKPYRV